MVSALGRWILAPFCLPSLRSRVFFSSFALSSPCQLLDQCLSSLWIIVWPPCEAKSVFCWDQGYFGRWICFPLEASSVLARNAWPVFPLEDCHYLLRKLCLASISNRVSLGQNQFSLLSKILKQNSAKLKPQCSDLSIGRLERLCRLVTGHCNTITGYWCHTWVWSLSKL